MKNARQVAGHNKLQSRSDAPLTTTSSTPETPAFPPKSPETLLLPSRIFLEVFAVYCSCLRHVKYRLPYTEKTFGQGAHGWV